MRAREMMTVFAVWLTLVMEYQLSMPMDKSVAMVRRLRGSRVELISGIVPIVQSAQRKLGVSRSQLFTNTKYNQCS